MVAMLIAIVEHRHVMEMQRLTAAMARPRRALALAAVQRLRLAVLLTVLSMASVVLTIRATLRAVAARLMVFVAELR